MTLLQLVMLLSLTTTDALLSPNLHKRIITTTATSSTRSTTQRHVSIGLGPEKQDDGRPIVESTNQPLIPGVDYEIPDHDAFRTSRRSPIDETCDEWFASLLGKDGMNNGDDDNDNTPVEPNHFFLRDIAIAARTKLLTPVELKNEVRRLSSSVACWCRGFIYCCLLLLLLPPILWFMNDGCCCLCPV